MNAYICYSLCSAYKVLFIPANHTVIMDSEQSVFVLVSLVTLSLLMTKSDSFFDPANGMSKLYYVRPNEHFQYPPDQDPCLTFNEYASEPDTFVSNHTTFYFHPGSHRLSSTLRVEGDTPFYFSRFA